jgi:hypothetical protein
MDESEHGRFPSNKSAPKKTPSQLNPVAVCTTTNCTSTRCAGLLHVALLWPAAAQARLLEAGEFSVIYRSGLSCCYANTVIDSDISSTLQDSAAHPR